MSHLHSYLQFCAVMQCSPLPLDNRQLGRYVAYLAQRLKYQSILKYLNIIQILHLETGLQNPLENNYFLNSILQGIKRIKGSLVQQKIPITSHILLRIRLLLDLHKPCDILFWATCLLAYFGLLRKSNLLPTSAKQFNPSKHPCRGDITKASGGLALHIKASKTIQFGERIHLLPLPYMQGHPLCPVTAITALLCHQPRQLAASSPLLTLPAGQLLTQPAFLSRLRALLQACGLPASDYSGHSFRRGAASAMFQAGLPGEVIQIMGDWKSDAYKLYLDIDIDSKFKLISPWMNLLPPLCIPRAI